MPTAVRRFTNAGYFVLVLYLGFATIGQTVGCVHAPPSLSATGKTDFYKTQVVHQLDLLRDTAIAANALPTPLLSTDDTREVVAMHRSLLLTLQGSTEGWVPAVKIGLDEMVKHFKPAQQAVVAPYVAAVKLILDEVVQ